MPPDEAAAHGVVTDARLAPGHWEILVDIGQPIVAHGELGAPPPSPGTRVGVSLEPSQTAVIGSQPRET